MTDSKRALFLVSRLHCQDGIASHLATLCDFLKRNGWHICFVTGMVDCPPSTAAVLQSIKKHVASFEIDPVFASATTNPVRFLRQAMRARHWAKMSRSTVLHLHGRALGPPTLLARLFGGPPRVYTKHLSHAVHRRRRFDSLRRYARRLWCDHAIAISRDLERNLQQDECISSDRIHYIPHGVDLEKFRPPTADERRMARAEFGLSESVIACLQLARVGRIKRPETLARACAALRDEGSDVVGLFAGHCDPPEAEFLLNSVPEHARPAIRILGQQEPREVIWAADVFVLCSEREGFAISVVEAMACGVVPVRTSVEGAIDQIVDQENGYLFGIEDEQALKTILRNLLVAECRKAVGESARLRAESVFGANAMAEKTARVYGETLN